MSSTASASSSSSSSPSSSWREAGRKVVACAATGLLVFVSVLVSELRTGGTSTLLYGGDWKQAKEWRVAAQAAAFVLAWNILGWAVLNAVQVVTQSQWVGALANALRIPVPRRPPGGTTWSLLSELSGYERIVRTAVALASAGFGLFYLKSFLAEALLRRRARRRREEEEQEAGRKSLDLEELIGQADLEDFKRRLSTLKTQAPAAQAAGSQERRRRRNNNNKGADEPGWKLMAKKKSSQLASQQYLQSNADDPLCGSRSICMQMLVETVFEDVRFSDVESFWIDDRFRGKWDRCFVSSEKVIECGCHESCTKGCGEVVRWVRKFPAFCSPREYIIARRSFCEVDEDGWRTVYVVSKSTECDVPPKIKRVNEYYSSWRIRLVPSEQRPGEWAVETMLLHYENLGFPNSIFKLAMKTFFGWFIAGLETNGLREYVKRNKGGPGAGEPRGKRPKAGGKGDSAATTGSGNKLGALGRRWRSVGLLAVSAVLVGKNVKRRARARR